MVVLLLVVTPYQQNPQVTLYPITHHHSHTTCPMTLINNFLPVSKDYSGLGDILNSELCLAANPSNSAYCSRQVIPFQWFD